jgi:hypothetical protein
MTLEERIPAPMPGLMISADTPLHDAVVIREMDL